MPHGDLEEVFPDVFVVTGTSRPNFMGADWQFSRNMTVIREGRSLTLVNTVRLDDERLTELASLGDVEHIVRLGAFHGMDDGFYKDRFSRARLWALPKMAHLHGLVTDEVLAPSGKLPFANGSIFAFETSAHPEGILHLDREGGILVSCDSLQNWVEADRYFDEASATKMAEIGFLRAANVGPGWLAGCSPQRSDFVRLRAMSFRHLLSAHGRPLRNEAHGMLSKRFDELGL